jgi:hypothetical protein
MRKKADIFNTPMSGVLDSLIEQPKSRRVFRVKMCLHKDKLSLCSAGMLASLEIPQKKNLQTPLPAPITQNMKKELTNCLWLPGLSQ